MEHAAVEGVRLVFAYGLERNIKWVGRTELPKAREN